MSEKICPIKSFDTLLDETASNAKSLEKSLDRNSSNAASSKSFDSLALEKHLSLLEQLLEEKTLSNGFI